MTNIITELEQRNKALSNEIETLKKQVADKEENLKWEIWKVGQEEWGYGVEGYKYSTFKKLNDKWLEEGKVRMAVDPNETREWAKGCKRIYYDNITIEEMLTGFADLSKELQLSSNKYISEWSQRGYDLYEQKKGFEKKLEKLNMYKEQLENLAKKIEELLLGYSELSEEDIEKERIYWQIGEPEELLEKIKGNVNEVNEVVMRVIEKWEIDAKTHFISFTETGKEFNDAQKAELREEIKDNLGIIEENRATIENQEKEIQKLREELQDNLGLLKEAKETIQSQEYLLNLANKPLPSLPKKQNKFQKLGTKIKTKLQQIAKAVRNEKKQEQLMIAQIEVRK